jgi:hypothetical protein
MAQVSATVAMATARPAYLSSAFAKERKVRGRHAKIPFFTFCFVA